MVPSWRLSSTGCGCRWGASRLFSRISRSTRRIEVRPSRTRSRAHTLRWPWPWKNDSWMVRRSRPATAHRCSESSSRGGQAAAGREADGAAPRRSTVAGPMPSAPERRPYGRPVGADWARLIWRDLHRRKGSSSSMRQMRLRRSSFSMASSAMTRFCQRPCSSTRFSCRFSSASAPAARKASRHSLLLAAVTPHLRLVDSRSAPRSSSRTMLVLRLAK